MMDIRKIKPVHTALALMVSSLLLLVVLQGLWLRNSYEKAYADLRKDASDVFRTTIHSLRDSAVMRGVRRAPQDTTLSDAGSFQFIEKEDCVKVDKQAAHLATTSEMKIIISSNGGRADSVSSLLPPILAELHTKRMSSQATFMVQLRDDTLSIDTLMMRLNDRLAEVGIDHNVKTRVISKRDMPVRLPGNDVMLRRRAFTDSAVADGLIHSEWVSYDPFHRYQLTLSSFQPMILRGILPQILFSIFVTLLTGTAFFIMYRSQRAQQRLMELKNDFISNITHELKTPVTTVSVALEALRNFNGLENPRTTKEYLDIAQSELNRLSLLTDKILKTAIFENKGIGFEPEPVDMLKTIEQILHSMKLVFEKQNATVAFDRVGDAFTIHGGSVHLTNVIYNLLDNALKYSGTEPSINITLEEDQRQVVLKVADKGIGIPAEYTRKIFEKFFRVPTGDVHNVKGYGLGLSYVQAVIRSHHGWIDVSSKPGEGSVFTITLPKQIAAS
jgi:two-component system phosphate regulon sensor histidine kinase PhoR